MPTLICDRCGAKVRMDRSVYMIIGPWGRPDKNRRLALCEGCGRIVEGDASETIPEGDE